MSNNLCLGCGLFNYNIVPQIIIYFYRENDYISTLKTCRTCINNIIFFNKFIEFSNLALQTSIRIYTNGCSAERTIDNLLLNNKLITTNSNYILEYKKILLPFIKLLFYNNVNNICEIIKNHGLICNCKLLDYKYENEWKSLLPSI